MTPHEPRRAGGRAGFVLVEALATLALSALVLAGAAGLVGLMLRQADRTAMSVERIETTGRAMLALSRDIRAAVRVNRPSGGKPSLVFAGSPDQLVLVLDEPAEGGLSRPVVVHWLSEATAAGRGRLVRSVAPLLPGQPTPPLGSGERTVVDTGTAVIRFAYYAAQPRGGGEVLTDSWSTPETLPRAVRLGAADPGSLVVTRSVRVPLARDAEIGCANPTAGYCSLTPNRRADPDAASTDRPEDRAVPEPGGAERPEAGQ